MWSRDVSSVPSGSGRDGCSPVKRVARLAGDSLLAGCAAGDKTTTGQRETVRSHVYPLPLDNVLAQATALMKKKGWAVKRAGNALLTNWQGGAALVAYRIHGERVDAGLSRGTGPHAAGSDAPSP
jgi:hypothetical protein